jgi:hypothetical protein
MEMKLYNTEAKAIGKIELNDTVFSVEYNEPLIHQVVVAQLANKRQGTKSTLTRSEVRGGGRKPYRQKAPAEQDKDPSERLNTLKAAWYLLQSPEIFLKR